MKILGLGENLRKFKISQKFWARVNIFCGRFPLVCMGSWVQSSRYKLYNVGGLVRVVWIKVDFFGARFPLVHMGSWVQSTNYKVGGFMFF